MGHSVAVFWDYENCRPPTNMSGLTIASRVKNIAQAYGQILLFKAYADVSFEYNVPNSKSGLLHSELQSSGITLAHCPHNGKKDVADKMMLVDMMAFAMDQPAPTAVTVVVISGDGDFSYGISTLKMRNFNMVVVAPTLSTNMNLLAQSNESLRWQDILVDRASDQHQNPVFGAQFDITNHLHAPQIPNSYSQSSNMARSMSHTYMSGVTKESAFHNTRDQIVIHDELERINKASAKHAKPSSSHNGFTSNSLHIYSNSPLATISVPTDYIAHRPSAPAPHLLPTANTFVPSTSPGVQNLRPVGSSKASFEPIQTATTQSTEVHASSLLQFYGTKPHLHSPQKQPDEPSILLSETIPSTFSSENVLFRETTSENDCLATTEEMQSNDLKSEHQSQLEVVAIDMATTDISTTSDALDQFQTEAGNMTPSSSPLRLQKSNLAITHSSVNQTPSSSKESLPESPIERKLSEIISSITSITDEAFKPLIQILKKAQAEGKMRLQWSQVGEKMRNQQAIYRQAGVDRFRGYINEAQKARVITIEGLDCGEDYNQYWIKLNVEDDRPERDFAQTKISSIDLNAETFVASGTTSALTPDPAFIPLIETIREVRDTGTGRALRSRVGEVMLKKFPGVYREAKVSGYSAYLERASKDNIASLGSSGHGRDWVKLLIEDV